jgi:hypothetical protein
VATANQLAGTKEIGNRFLPNDAGGKEMCLASLHLNGVSAGYEVNSHIVSVGEVEVYGRMRSIDDQAQWCAIEDFGVGAGR